MNSSFGIAAFRSRTQVLRMEDALRRAGLSAGVISTPREVAIGCGLSVRFELADMQQVMAVYRRLNPSALIGLRRCEWVSRSAERAACPWPPARRASRAGAFIACLFWRTRL